MTVSDFSEITKKKPEKSLTRPLKKKGGRNSQGVITAAHRGGGHKRRYRIIDFKRDKDDMNAEVIAIEYDPNRSARIALLQYADGDKRYIIAPEGLNVGQIVISGQKVEPNTGNAMPLESIPNGLFVHNIETRPGNGARMARSAGTAAQIVAKEGRYALLLLSSGEMRRVLGKCRATIGRVGNAEHNGITIGKAGRKRWLGRRPHVRGMAMNPVAHPMGGGEGRRKGGRPPCSKTGLLAKGGKTRKSRPYSDKLIVRRRK